MIIENILNELSFYTPADIENIRTANIANPFGYKKIKDKAVVVQECATKEGIISQLSKIGDAKNVRVYFVHINLAGGVSMQTEVIDKDSVKLYIEKVL